MPEGVQGDIFRPATIDEKKDFIEIGAKDAHQEFLARLAKTEQGFIKEHKPFCGRCANFDFQDKFKKATTESERRLGYVDYASAELAKVDIGDLTKYSEIDRFKLLDVSEVTENKLIDGVRVPYLIGYHLNYVCKIRGCGVTVFVPKEIYEQRKGTKK